MKKVLIIVLAAILCPYIAMAQAKQIHLILDKYEKRKKVESIIISPAVLQMAGNGNYNASTKELLSKISEMRIVNVKEDAVEGTTPLRDRKSVV